MRQTNVCSNRVFKVYVCKFYVKCVSQGLTQAFVLTKKVCDENQKKQRKMKKMTGTSYKVTREMRAR